MCPSDRRFDPDGFHIFHICSRRYGTPEALGDKGVPYVPYVPYLFSPVRVGAHGRACRRMHRPVRPRARMRVTVFPYGTYGRYGRGPQDKASGVPYLCHISGRYGR